MLILLKLCVPVWMLVTGTGAQVDICDNVPVLEANTTTQTLTSVGIETDENDYILCTTQITVTAGTSLKLQFTSIIMVASATIGIYTADPSTTSTGYLVGVSLNELIGSFPPIYVFSESVYIGIRYGNMAATTFVMTYEEVAFEESICTLPPLVHADNTTRQIVTPNFGNGPYFDNQLCGVAFTGTREVKVEVTDYDIECPFDRVTICVDVECFDLCGTAQRIFQGNNVNVTFFSDVFWAFKGMRLEYSTDTGLSDWTSWESTVCYRDCYTYQRRVNDTRTRTCLQDSCLGELNEERTRDCTTYCDDCLLG